MPTEAAAGRLTVLRLFGVEISVHFSWIVIALLIAWSLAAGSFPMLYEGLPASAYWTMAAIVVVGLAVSIVLHELAHTLVGRAMGMSIERITLFLFGGVAELREEPAAPRTELFMAIAGPIVSVILSFLFAGLAGGLRQGGGAPELVGAFGYLATLNLVVAIFNMIPAFPLDGGRVLRAIIWMITRRLDRATRIATRMGEGFGLLLILAGLASALFGTVAGGLWWVLIGLFITFAARSARADMEAKAVLGGHAISEIMTGRVETASAEMTVDDFVERHLYATRHGLYPLVQGDRWTGVVEPERLLRVPREAWATTRLGEVCTPAAETPVAAPDEDSAKVLDRMRRENVARLPVVDRGRLVGIVTLQDLMERMQLDRQFGPRRS